MRRPFATTLAVFAALVQLALGFSTPLGLVLCVGETHAAIELASGECCDSHGILGRALVPALERTCCSDVLLRAAALPLGDGPRAHASVAATASPPAVVAGLPGSGWLAAVDPASPSSGLARRSVVLRV